MKFTRYSDYESKVVVVCVVVDVCVIMVSDV